MQQNSKRGFRPFFADKNGKARHVGGQYDNRASYIERTTLGDVFDDVVAVDSIDLESQRPVLDTPELRLVAAVMEDAARILALKTLRANEHLKRQALSWVKGTVDSMPGFSFAECCAWLRLDEDYMREQVIKLSTRNKGIGRRYHTIVRHRAQDRIAV